MQTRSNANWAAAMPCFLFTVVLAMFSVVFQLPLALRIVMVVIAVALLAVGGGLLGRSLRGAGWRPSDDRGQGGPGSGDDAGSWLPSNDRHEVSEPTHGDASERKAR